MSRFARLACGCGAYVLFWLGDIASHFGRLDVFGALYQRAMAQSSRLQDLAGWGPWEDVAPPSR